MSDRKIIAFYSPYTSAGKTTAVMCLSGFALYSFANMVKDFTKRIFGKQGFKFFEKDIPIAEMGSATPRDLWKAFANAGRAVYPDIWVDIGRYDIKRITRLQNVAIDDLRFPNEYAMLKDIGAKIVRITNPEREIIKTETEGLLEGFDFDCELVNYKRSLEEYRTQIGKMMSELWP
ncbi:MAG: hypothetical protein IJ667_07195 [Synergistaceae bacterium]|nr:hypothetical protein [Synergistaceae bacterium]